VEHQSLGVGILGFINHSPSSARLIGASTPNTKANPHSGTKYLLMTDFLKPVGVVITSVYGNYRISSVMGIKY
jgi:hypothetical protein